MTFCHTHRSGPCSATIQDASPCSRWEWIQRPTARVCGEGETWEHSALTGASLFLPSGLREPTDEDSGRVEEPEWVEDAKKKEPRPAPGPLHIYYGF